MKSESSIVFIMTEFVLQKQEFENSQIYTAILKMTWYVKIDRQIKWSVCFKSYQYCQNVSIVLSNIHEHNTLRAFVSFGMWHYATGLVFPSICKVLENTNTVTLCHIPEGLNPKQNVCRNLRSSILYEFQINNQ